ncbi:L-lactate dehydrogenase [cytochrome] [Bartonella vinsonii subsp. arupensis OK-94-513]|uniref:L-lactate dehydrogenase n=3 Tax=Bartonella vinsonii TaxID=33047 RepID=J1JSQ6_BARVI|nr:L-lactate dehydrogenase [cytochrome] [Bartonella vinsonii subsp. arupensis OK-94-513]EJF98901.1 L-lactate dehydrogenase [cytochrome] [Bartonella vinsonii subsp. arupensis Pm136co]
MGSSLLILRCFRFSFRNNGTIMIISSTFDYRKAAKRRLPPFLFHYIDGGAYAEETMRRNCTDLQALALRQKILKQIGEVDLSTKLFDQTLNLPIILAPVGLTGMYARRGEVQAARAAVAKGIPFTLSSVSVCPIAEVQKAVGSAFWFQLYVLKDRGFMRDALERAWESGVRTLVFTVDMPVPGARYRDAHSGMSGPYAGIRRILQAFTHPHWAWNVGVMGRPHDLGNVSTYLQKKIALDDYVGWLGANFDPSIGWRDLQWIRDFWKGKMILKGILDPEDAQEAVHFGADGLVVSNHGGRQLDGVLSTARALPAIAEAVKGKLTILADSGVRSGLDVVRMIAQGADAVMIGRAFVYALAAAGEKGVAQLLDLFANEMRVAMTLTGVQAVKEITRENLVRTDAFE